MPIERLYDRVFPSCSTINELNRFHILLENRMTPMEATQLAAHIRQFRGRRFLGRRVDAVRVLGARVGGRVTRRGGARSLSGRERHARSVEWADRLSRRLGLAAARAPSQVSRRWLRGGATLFQASAEPSTALIVGFTGNAPRLMMSTPQFLQHLAPFGVDLLLLHAGRGSAYAHGVRGFSSEFPGTVAWLGEFARSHGATRLVTVGTSGGGLPAVLAGLALRADSVLAAGTVITMAADFARSDRACSGDAPTLGEVIAQFTTGQSTPHVTLLYGCDSRMDTDAALALAAALSGSDLLPVEEAGHGCLYPLAERGLLEDVLRATLFDDRPTAREASR